MASPFLSSILSKTSQALGCVRRWAVSPSSLSDPRSSVLKDLEKLERTLKRIQAVLHDAEEREIRDESAVKLWLKELKEVAYQADDVLDEYQYEVLRAQVEGRASGRKRKRVEGDDEEEVSIPDGMGDRIRDIRERFDEISQDRERLRLREEDGERRVLEAPYPAPTSHMVDESSIYGREHDKQEVIDLLFSEGVGNGVSVIPIVGKGGLGKTTIAQLVYKDPKVKQYFNLTGWVCVSDDFDVPRLTKAIIESLPGSSCDSTQLSKLQDTLKEKVKGKRVLLVLDDVWNEQQSRWESLRNPFVGAETVTIIMTCRNDSVAEIMQTVRPYHPRCLSEEQSWALFRHYAFGGRDPVQQPSLVDMGKQIVEKCSGLPLVVKSIGSLLRYTADEDSWMDVIQSDIWEVDEKNEILPALRLSYSRMPARLKPCFVYCSMFPKDYLFEKDELVRLWMVQGYIQTCGSRSIEDIGDEYFIDLQRRSFFDSYHSNFFKMHDMIHDLAKSIAENEFWAIMGKKLPSHDEVRHLYVTDEKKFWKSPRLHNFSALRTLLIMPWFGFLRTISEIIKNLPLLRCLRALQFCWEMEDEIPDLLGNLKHLRYLRITSNKIEKLPKSICLLYHLQILALNCRNLAELPDSLGNLTSLRYFELSMTRIRRLPGTVCQLRNLQMLVLKGYKGLEELLNGIGSLTNLHHLQIRNGQIFCLPAGIQKLTKLHSLLGCYKVQGGIGGLKNLMNLETLIISGLKNVVKIEDARDAGLKRKHKLQKLGLHWNAIDCINDPYHKEHYYRLLHLEAFSGENKDASTDEKREEVMLEYLQPHANLKMLLINGYGGSKFPEWMENVFSFASLQEIDIMDCEKIRSLALYIHDSLGNLDAPISTSMLERVYISDCRQLTSIAGLHHLHSLKNLKIYNCPQLRLLSEGLPSNLQHLHIEECQQLTSLSGMQNLTSPKKLIIQNCRQLQLFSDLLPSNLEDVHIEECRWLTLLPGFQNLTSHGALIIRNCPQLRLLSEEELPSNLQDLHVEECQQLTSLSRMQNFIFLERLTIRNCPQLRDLSKEGLPSNLQDLHIEVCQQLTSLSGMQNLTSLRTLTIKNCPQLRLLSEEGLPSNLQYLLIKKCQQLTLLPGMQNLSSLRALTIKNYPQLRLLSEEGLPSNLQYLLIKKCQQLTLLSGVQNLTSLRALTIRNCPQLRLLSEEGLPSNLQDLHIEECQQLTSLPRMQNLTSPRSLIIKNCPKLQIMLEDQLSSMPDEVKIVDCPGLSNWCQIQRINCIQIASGNKLTISNTWEKIMRGFDDLTYVEHLCFSNSWEPFQQRDSIPIIEELTIWGCTDISPPLLWYPPMLASIRSLVIKDCPGVRLLRDELLPSMLKSLVVDSCENLRCLHLVQQNRDVFEELQIVNCPKIAMVQGLNHPFFPKFLTIEQCPQLPLSQDDWRPFIHPRLQIAGMLETKFYPPHSEETENKETIDDGTQEKQVSDWVKTEHANSIVSSIFDAADDCNMGQFLQLELPSGFYSQLPVHNNAEPLHADNSVASPICDDAIDCNMGQFLQLGFPSGCSSQSPVHNNAEPSN